MTQHSTFWPTITWGRSEKPRAPTYDKILQQINCRTIRCISLDFPAPSNPAVLTLLILKIFKGNTTESSHNGEIREEIYRSLLTAQFGA
ncbi:hypothetical protein BXT84_12370 [Sulfobacillus thermotolerans]|uniref:Uncharacterized protein n=1 Tax=Sulfobacillus thermotolerans TaxID=338644 RepID=A0ABN5H5D0_9FIRM|nr:hypothetical protein BXT84_12370 [Sulfobacillus thermotolerans]